MQESRVKYLKSIGATRENIDEITEMDPTGGEYAVWCFGNLGEIEEKGKAGEIKSFSEIRNFLVEFNRLKSSPKMKEAGFSTDINTYGLQELASLVAKRHELKSRRQAERDLDGAEIVYDQDGWKVYRAYTRLAVTTLGKGSGWCTTQRDTAQNYLNRGQLWIFHFQDIPYLQLHNDHRNEDRVILYRNNQNVTFGKHHKVLMYDLEVYRIIFSLSKTFVDMHEMVQNLLPVEVRKELLIEPISLISDHCLDELLQSTSERIPELEERTFTSRYAGRYIWRFGCEEMIPLVATGNYRNAYALAVKLGRRIPELEDLIAFGGAPSNLSVTKKDAREYYGEVAVDMDMDMDMEAHPYVAPQMQGVFNEAFAGQEADEVDPEDGPQECIEEASQFTEEWVYYLDKFMDMGTYTFRSYREAEKWFNNSKNLVYNPSIVKLMAQNFFSLQRLSNYLNRLGKKDEWFESLLDFMGATEPKTERVSLTPPLGSVTGRYRGDMLTVVNRPQYAEVMGG